MRSVKTRSMDVGMLKMRSINEVDEDGAIAR